jgi:hypothetical protein
MREYASIAHNRIIKSDEDENGFGGGIYLGKGSVTMQDNSTVKDNAANWGGGIYLEEGSVTMQDNSTVKGNAANVGGGICVDAAAAVLVMKGSAEVSGNKTGGESEPGGGVYLRQGKFDMYENAVISGNSASNGGGVMVGGPEKTRVTLQMFNDAVIRGNKAGYMGGGVCVDGSGALRMRDNAAIRDNSAVAGGGILMLGYLDTGDNAAVTGNTASQIGGGLLIGKNGTDIDGSIRVSNNHAPEGPEYIYFNN